MSDENSVVGQKPRKKRRSLWWLWFLLILAAFAGGAVVGLKLNTLPLPTEVRDRLYPVLEEYIPGSTTPRAPEPAATPEPAVTPEPAATPEPVVTPEPAPETVFAPVQEAAPAAEGEAVKPASDTETFEAAPARYIGVDAALEGALKHAEVAEQDAEITGVVRTKDADGKSVYEVSFNVGELIYHYTLDAYSGEVESWELSGLSIADDATYAASFTGDTVTEAEAAAPEGVDEERAKEIAYEHASVKPDEILRESAELFQGEDGEYYRLEFRTAKNSFVYEIDAVSGEVLSFEKN